MTPTGPYSGSQVNGVAVGESIVQALEQEEEKVRDLTEKLVAREAELAELRQNSQWYKQFLFAKLREESEREFPVLESLDLEKLIEKEGGLPLSAFIHELEAAE